MPTWAEIRAMVPAGGYLRRPDASPAKPSQLLNVQDVRAVADAEIRRLDALLQRLDGAVSYFCQRDDAHQEDYDLEDDYRAYLKERHEQIKEQPPRPP